MTNNPSFIIYSVSMLVLCLNVLFLWGYSGFVRGRSKTAMNPEDGRKVVDQDPPEVARVLRAHRNAMDNIVPFAILAFVLVEVGASPLVTGILCGAFTLLRLAHSLSYLAAKQPWRTLSFVGGALTTLVVMGFVAKAIIAAV